MERLASLSRKYSPDHPLGGAVCRVARLGGVPSAIELAARPAGHALSRVQAYALLIFPRIEYFAALAGKMRAPYHRTGLENRRRARWIRRDRSIIMMGSTGSAPRVPARFGAVPSPVRELARPANSFLGPRPTALRHHGTATRVSGPLFNPRLAVSNNRGGNLYDLPQERGIRKEEIYVG